MSRSEDKRGAVIAQKTGGKIFDDVGGGGDLLMRNGKKVFVRKKDTEKRSEKGEIGVRAKKKRGERRESIYVLFQKAGMYSAVFMTAFFVALISASAFTPVDSSEAATTEVNLDAGGYSLEVSSAGTVSMDLTATSGGVVAIEKDTLNVQTNSTGYKVYLSMSGNDNTLRPGAGQPGFSASAGTVTNPIALVNNTWGWARTVSNTETNTVLNSYGFSSSYCIGSDGTCYTNGSTTSSGTGSVNENNLFAGVPVAGSSVLVAASSVKPPAAGDNHNIYFGVRATTALTSGTYSGTVLYTAVAEATEAAAGEASISPASTTNKKTAETLTVTTSLYSSEVPANNEVSVTVGGETCAVTNVAKVSASDDAIKITCTTPNDLIMGDYDVVATISKYDRVYTLKNAYAVYVPWATMDAAADNTYSLQDFTARACNEANSGTAPAAYSSGTSVISGGTVNTSVPEVVLKDERDGSTGYRVRKLADGNCWMVDNLKLELSTGDPLDSELSDINYNMDSGAGAKYGKDYNYGDIPAYGRTTATRQISNDLVGTTNPLGVYNTVADGTVEWTPFADTQKGTGTGSDNPTRYGYNISWASPYKDKDGTPATSGTDVAATYRHFGMDGKTVVTEGATYKVNNNEWAEYARSYSNAASGQTGVGDGSGSEGKIQMNDGDGQPQYYGNYYNLYAASAGSVTYKMTSGDGMNSICPRNWMLPRNSGDKSWYNLLYTKYAMTVTGNGSSEPDKAAAIIAENTALKKAPFSIIQAGYYDSARGSLLNRGSDALYWSSHPYSQTYANSLDFYSTQSFRPQSGNSKLYGFTVRCVAR